MNISKEHNSLLLIKDFIINEIDVHIGKQNLQKKCMAITANGKQCSNKVKTESNVCKKHTNCSSLVKERKNYSCVLYHNHLPSDINITSCPKCLTMVQ